MDSFICDLARALGRGMAADLRAGAGPPDFGRGEWMAIATVLEITGAGPAPDPGAALPAEAWARMETLARRDLDLVRNARPKTA